MTPLSSVMALAHFAAILSTAALTVAAFGLAFAAIYRAAQRIEREPSSYDFGSIYTSRYGGCKTPHCMWGWIGTELGIYNKCILDVFRALDDAEGRRLYAMCGVGRTTDTDIAAAGMRAYADRYFPAEQPEQPEQQQLDPSYLAFKARLTEMVGA